jgi:hypothetical protein
VLMAAVTRLALALDPDPHHLDPALGAVLDHRAADRRNNQHHDARRVGVCPGHSGRRCNGRHESINTHLEQGEAVEAAILNGAREIAIPALVATQPNPMSFYDLIYRIFRQSDH